MDTGRAERVARRVLSAADRLEGVVRDTPLRHSPSLTRIADREVYLKLENLQRTGSFKFRGAYAALSALDEARKRRGVVTASAGNHGAGVALAASLLGMEATVFAPASAPAAKRARIQRDGASLRLVDGDYELAHREALAEAERTGRLYLHAFSDPEVVAGQGTVLLEILRYLPQLAAVVLPVGGGGLLGGVGALARIRAPRVAVLGVQSTATPAMHASLAAGRPVSPPPFPTLCDGLAGEVDADSLALAADVVDTMCLVPEAAVPAAIRHLHRYEGITVEGSGAVGVAALLEASLHLPHGPVAIVVTGGNLDREVLEEVLSGEAAS